MKSKNNQKRCVTECNLASETRATEHMGYPHQVRLNLNQSEMAIETEMK